MKEKQLKNLFNDFPEVSAKEWKQQIQVDLKGADYNETLVWNSPEGIDVKPFYHNDETPIKASIPGHPSHWSITQAIYIDDFDIAKSLSQEALSKGANALRLITHKSFDYKGFFNDLDTANSNFYFDFLFWDKNFFMELAEYLTKQNIKFHLGLDPIAHLQSDGNWFHEQNNLNELAEVVKAYPKASLRVDMRSTQNAGANINQQIAFALSHANEYLHHLNQAEADLSQVNMLFHTAVGSYYFFEIAKIRALRLAYATLAVEYNAKTESQVLAMPSKRNKTLYDYNVNMLRTTTECMSAILGGANAIENMPYDAIFHKDNPFGSRIARNQLLVLKEESYFDKVSNPADGTYYIENLTVELGQKALELFKQIEKNGGYIQALFDHRIQERIQDAAKKEQKLFDEGKIKLLGTNMHPNPQDKMQHDLELFPFVKKNIRKTIFPPIIEKRLAEAMELERLEEEKKA